MVNYAFHEPTLGERIALLRRRKGLKQRELAAAAGIHRPWLSRIESGSVLPGRPLVCTLARLLGVPEAALLDALPQ
jgi:transcriptional regulator with XRE-family HTH domain